MRALTTAIILGFFAFLASPAFADGPLTARTDAQKDEDARIDRAYKAATRSYDGAVLARTEQTARWAAGRRRRYPRGVVPVVCLVRSRWLERVDGAVLVVSLDRIVPALKRSAAERRVAAAPPARGAS